MEQESVVVGPSGVNGKGVFAAIDFAEGDVILRRDDSRLVTEENPLREGENVYHCDWLPDGRVVYVGEPERYTNHSCDPNAYVKEIDGVRHCVARRPIAAGEEITYDYCIDNWGGHHVAVWLWQRPLPQDDPQRLLPPAAGDTDRISALFDGGIPEALQRAGWGARGGGGAQVTTAG